MVKQHKKEISTYIGKNHAATKRERQRFPPDRFPIHFNVCFDKKEEALSKSLKGTLKAMFSSQVRYARTNYYNTTNLDCYFNHVVDLEKFVGKSFKGIRLVNYLPDGQNPIYYSRSRIKKEAKAILETVNLSRY